MTTPKHRAAASPWAPALAGAAAGAVALAASELVAGLSGAPSLIVAVGTLAIDLQPPGAKDVVVSLFGTSDKVALIVLVIVLALALAAIAGILAARRFSLGAAVFVAFGALAAGAAIRSPLVEPVLAVVNAAIAVGAALVTLRFLLGLLGTRSMAPVSAPSGENHPAATDGAASGSPRGTSGHEPEAAPSEWTRRRFLIASAGTIGVAAVAGGIGRSLIDAQHVEGVVSTSSLPKPLMAVPPLAPDQVLTLPGLTPLVVPNDAFYRIDTALLVPRVDVATWQLKVTGMVDRPLTFTYDELLTMPLYEQYVTISCVSNRVGGDLVGNALWTGVRLKDVLDAAGVQQGATQIVGRSVDGFTAGFPTSWAMAPDREAMIAVGMNREPLPARHGFPARLIVPGLYGYVSATKWLSEIELTTREAVDGYWVPLGWAKDAPILTQSRIDLPAAGARVAPGPTDIAGVAWAPERGVAGVEVRIDDGPWQQAQITRPISKATWVQWTFPWTAANTGRHGIEVRATDDTGDVQTDKVSDPAPDGARGHHRIFVDVG